MQVLPHGLPVTQCGAFVVPPLRQELMNCLRAPPLMPLACALQSFIFYCCEVSCALAGAVSATKIAATTIYRLISRSLLRAELGEGTPVYLTSRLISTFK